MAFIEWRDALSTKIVQFDDEHKVLIKLINELYEAMMAGKGKDALSKTLGELTHYTETHFKREEEFLAKHNYDGLDFQKQQHEYFVAKLKDLKKDFEAGKVAVSIALSNFLNTWLVDHIQKVDVKYSYLAHQ